MFTRNDSGPKIGPDGPVKVLFSDVQESRSNSETVPVQEWIGTVWEQSVLVPTGQFRLRCCVSLKHLTQGRRQRKENVFIKKVNAIFIYCDYTTSWIRLIWPKYLPAEFVGSTLKNILKAFCVLYQWWLERVATVNYEHLHFGASWKLLHTFCAGLSGRKSWCTRVDLIDMLAFLLDWYWTGPVWTNADKRYRLNRPSPVRTWTGTKWEPFRVNIAFSCSRCEHQLNLFGRQV